MQKLLLTGATGFLGQAVIAQLQEQYEIHGLYFNNKPNASISSYKINIADSSALKNIVKQIQPQLILHTAAISSLAACEADAKYSHQVNVEASKELALLANALNATFIFCSTDMVFDGAKGNYLETDTPNPLSLYGQQKYIAEQEIVKANPKSIIARLPLLIGKIENSSVGIIPEMITANNEGKMMNLFTDEYRSPVWVNDAVLGLELLCKENKSGIYHLGGKENWNRYEIGCMVQLQLNLNDVSLNATTHAHLGITNRPKNGTLNSSKMFELGYQPAFLADVLSKMQS
jgi:dTDP-4-dehydrorhamnose reductase